MFPTPTMLMLDRNVLHVARTSNRKEINYLNQAPRDFGVGDEVPVSCFRSFKVGGAHCGYG